MNVYLDNAATTKLDPEVLKVMLPYLENDFGNPSSIHAYGRKTRSAIEMARKQVASLLGVTPKEIFFTSGGTEADNTAIFSAFHNLKIKHAISSKIEHHAVEHTLVEACNRFGVELHYVNLDQSGSVDLLHLESLLEKYPGSFVSLMHANNEIGNLLPIDVVGEMCKNHGAFFHSDTVQTIGHYPLDFSKTPIHFAACAAHKFHGPKGVGFLFINHQVKIPPYLHGGAQERNMRGGTENVYGIVGLAKALELAYANMDEHRTHIQGLKKYMVEKLKESIEGVEFNGASADESLYTVLNVRFPKHKNAEMLLFNLDIAGIAASGGSACSSGSEQGSHVLRGINAVDGGPSVRFSFSKYNTKSEIDYTLEKLKVFFESNVLA
jgi:cysteine desulfurase